MGRNDPAHPLTTDRASAALWVSGQAVAVLRDVLLVGTPGWADRYGGPEGVAALTVALHEDVLAQAEADIAVAAAWVFAGGLDTQWVSAGVIAGVLVCIVEAVRRAVVHACATAGPRAARARTGLGNGAAG